MENLSAEFILVILGLATWRLSSLLANEDGPFDWFRRLRQAAGVRVDSIGQSYYTNTFAKGLSCVWCNSIWVGMALAVVYYLLQTVILWLALPLVLSALAVFYQTVLSFFQQLNQWNTSQAVDNWLPESTTIHSIEEENR